MKKILTGIMCAAAAIAFAGCASTKEAGASGSAGGDIPPALSIYNFEEPIEDGDVPDASGNDLVGYAGGDGSLTDGKYGKAMVLNGSDCYISLDESVFDSDEFTFAAWVKPDMWKDWARIVDIGDGATTDLWLGYAGVEHQLRLDVFGTQGAPVTLLAATPAAGQWTHVAFTLGNGKASLYVNGNLIQQVPCANKLSGFVHGQAYVGRSNWGADPLFTGAVDEVFVSGTCATGKQIKTIMKGLPAAK